MTSGAGSTALHGFADGESCYRIAYPGTLVWAHWETDSCLFNGGTGETHLLSPIPTEIVSLLQQGSMPFANLCATMARFCDEIDSPAWREKMAAVIADLVALDIIEPDGDAR